MENSYFFGYGSLLNINTHTYRSHERAYITGWQRRWSHTVFRDIPYLSVYPVVGGKIHGLVALVPNNDWKALDVRETGYKRKYTKCTVGSKSNNNTQIYYVPTTNLTKKDTNKGILLSYLDCVIQGYLHQFGEEVAAEFFTSTDGWDICVTDDRLQPIYPRSVNLTTSERVFVDHHLLKIQKSL